MNYYMNLTNIFFPIYYVCSIFIFDFDLQSISNSTSNLTGKTNLRIGYVNLDDDYNNYYYDDDLEYNIYIDDLVV